MNKYFLFGVKVVGEIADAFEDGKITQEEMEEFALFLIKEVPKLFRNDNT